MEDEAEIRFPNCSISFVLLLPHVDEHYHEEELDHFYFNAAIVSLVSRNCCGLFPLQSTILSPCTISDGTPASGNSLVPRSFQATGQISSCCYT